MKLLNKKNGTFYVQCRCEKKPTFSRERKKHNTFMLGKMGRGKKGFKCESLKVTSNTLIFFTGNI